MLFTHNKIKEEEKTVAEKLRTAREGKKITIASAAQKLAINPEYLAALESGDYRRLPSGVYGKTYLKKYGSFLELNWPRLEEKYKKESRPATEEKKDVFAKKKIATRELLVFPKILKNILILIFVAALLFYLGYYLKNSFSEPTLIITSPADDLITADNEAEVIGQADPKTQITINGLQILKDGAGNFQKNIKLKKGLNVITISAQNKYSRKKIIEKQVLVAD